MSDTKNLFSAPTKGKELSKRDDYQNQHVISINKLPAHTPPQCFASEKEALCGRLEEEDKLRTTNCIVLSDPNNKWDFNFSETPSICPPVMEEHGGFFIKGDEYYKWTKISVPSNWECEGFGQAVYTNFQYPFKVDVSVGSTHFVIEKITHPLM
jgi:beta-galactosidase